MFRLALCDHSIQCAVAPTIARAVGIVVAALAITSSASAAPIHEREVKCGDRVLGTMEIDTYQVGEEGTGAGNNPFLGFVEIEGQFVPGPLAVGHVFHYLQVVTTDDNPPRFTDGTANTTPYVDTPPGGYQGDPFDFQPYYDEGGSFPGFFDQPEIFLNFTKNQADMQRELEFETWLVCVIEETLGGTANLASDDNYKVAPLLGWTWGFEQTYADAAPLGTDGLNDITQTITPFSFIAAPSANWTAALGVTYGTAPNQDRFNIMLGDCADCIPEPASGGMLAVAALAVGLRRRTSGPTRSAIL